MQLEPGRRLKAENNMSNHVLKEFVVRSGTSTQAVYRGLHFTLPGVSADHIHACGRNQEKKESYEEITRTYSTECVSTYTCVLFSFLTLIHSGENSLFCCQGVVINFPCRYRNIRAHTSTLFLISTNLFICLMLRVM